MEKRKNLKLNAEKIKMLSNQYELLLQAWSENAMLFHDMSNHLQTIYLLAGEGKCEDIRQYISRISKPTEQLSGILWTGVGIVDAVLNAKKQLATEKGYAMDINAQLPANTGIAEDDFCTVLTNLLSETTLVVSVCAVRMLRMQQNSLCGRAHPVIANGKYFCRLL